MALRHGEIRLVKNNQTCNLTSNRKQQMVGTTYTLRAHSKNSPDKRRNEERKDKEYNDSLSGEMQILSENEDRL